MLKVCTLSMLREKKRINQRKYGHRGESSSAWFPTIDKTNQKQLRRIYMTVPDKYVTLSNGILKESKKKETTYVLTIG
jgi:hypothetical protein